VLDDALRAAGIARDELYVTNAVKHFHHVPRGRRRIHQRPTTAHVVSCRAWLDAELATVRPAVIVCLGVTAAQSFFGPGFRLRGHRGVRQETRHGAVVVTHHPAAILRQSDPVSAERARAELVADLAAAITAPA
jgi:uracil-DNA glycosylase